MQADYKVLAEYKKMVDQVSSVYGERTKETIIKYIDTTLKNELKKTKIISSLFVVFGILLTPILIGIQMIVVGAVLFYIGPFRISRLIEQYKELVESDTSLA